jgi:hypothetical protein
MWLYRRDLREVTIATARVEVTVKSALWLPVELVASEDRKQSLSIH